MVWLRSDAYTVQAYLDAWWRAGSPDVFVYSPPLVENLTLTLGEMEEGAYAVDWFDPQTGKWLESVEGVARQGELSIPIPPFRRDLAAKVTPR